MLFNGMSLPRERIGHQGRCGLSGGRYTVVSICIGADQQNVLILKRH